MEPWIVNIFLASIAIVLVALVFFAGVSVGVHETKNSILLHWRLFGRVPQSPVLPPRV